MCSCLGTAVRGLRITGGEFSSLRVMERKGGCKKAPGDVERLSGIPKALRRPALSDDRASRHPDVVGAAVLRDCVMYSLCVNMHRLECQSRLPRDYSNCLPPWLQEGVAVTYALTHP